MLHEARWQAAHDAIKRKMGFAYWEFCSGFGVYDPQQDHWIEPPKEALLPPAPSK
jgi:endoglucanase